MGAKSSNVQYAINHRDGAAAEIEVIWSQQATHWLVGPRQESAWHRRNRRCNKGRL